MSDFILATASTCDLPIQYLKEHHIPFISYTYVVDGKEYKDDCEEASKQSLMKLMRQGIIPQTSQITMYAYLEFFRSLLQQGKDVLYLDMSRSLSGSILNAEMAIREIQKDFPQQRIYFLDSYCVSGGLALFMKELVRQKEAGIPFEEVIAWGEQHKKEYVHRFMVEDLQWLRRGGRLSNASAFVAGLLAIKPKIYLDNQGQLLAYGKVRGRKKCLHELIADMQEDIDPENKEDLVVIHADCRKDAEEFATAICEQYPYFPNVMLIDLGSVIASHVGPDFLAVVYHGKKRVR